MSGLPTGVGHSHVRRSRYRQNVDTRMGARGEKSVVGAPDTRAPRIHHSHAGLLKKWTRP